MRPKSSVRSCASSRAPTTPSLPSGSERDQPNLGTIHHPRHGEALGLPVPVGRRVVQPCRTNSYAAGGYGNSSRRVLASLTTESYREQRQVHPRLVHPDAEVLAVGTLLPTTEKDAPSIACLFRAHHPFCSWLCSPEPIRQPVDGQQHVGRKPSCGGSRA